MPKRSAVISAAPRGVARTNAQTGRPSWRPWRLRRRRILLRDAARPDAAQEVESIEMGDASSAKQACSQPKKTLRSARPARLARMQPGVPAPARSAVPGLLTATSTQPPLAFLVRLVYSHVHPDSATGNVLWERESLPDPLRAPSSSSPCQFHQQGVVVNPVLKNSAFCRSSSVGAATVADCLACVAGTHDSDQNPRTACVDCQVRASHWCRCSQCCAPLPIGVLTGPRHRRVSRLTVGVGNG